MNLFMKPRTLFILFLKKWRGFHPLTLRCAAFGYNELRPRQSADVIAHCPLSIKYCTFESESNDSYVCMLLFLISTSWTKIDIFCKSATLSLQNRYYLGYCG